MGGLRRIPRLETLYGRSEVVTSFGVPLWRARIGGNEAETSIGVTFARGASACKALAPMVSIGVAQRSKYPVLTVSLWRKC
jgi:hypothetical protein